MAKKAVKTEKKELKKGLSSREIFDMTSQERETYFTKFPEEKEKHFPGLSEEQTLSDMTSQEREIYLAEKAKKTEEPK